MPSETGCKSPISELGRYVITMTSSRTQFTDQSCQSKDPLLSCLSRLILEPDWVNPEHSARTARRPFDSGVVSRAIVQETLLSGVANDKSSLAGDVPSKLAS